jgi:hypothetical protein
VERHHDASSSASTPWSSTAETSCTSRQEGEDSATTLTESSGFSTSVGSTPSSHRHPLPTMTAEQLKLALLRLRSRIKTAQM